MWKYRWLCKGYRQWMCHLLEFWGMTPVHPLSYVLVLEYQVSGHCGCTGIHYFYKWRVDRVLLLKFTGSGAYVITVQGHVHAYSWLLFMHLQGRHKSVLYTHTLVLSCWLSHGVVKSLLPSLLTCIQASAGCCRSWTLVPTRMLNVHVL